MHYELLMIPFWTLTTISSQVDNTSDIFIVHNSHSDLDRPVKENPDEISVTTAQNELTGDTKELEEKATTKGFDRYYEEDWLTDRKAERFKDEHHILPKTTEGLDEVVFIPNDKEDAKGETNLRNIMKGDDSIVSLMNKVEVETEGPKEDIVFLSGKNDDVVHRIEEKQPENDKEHTTKKPKVVLDCKDLNCNNNKASVCGGKEEEHKWKFRLTARRLQRTNSQPLTSSFSPPDLAHKNRFIISSTKREECFPQGVRCFQQWTSPGLPKPLQARLQLLLKQDRRRI
ncbi:unnamed protein product [Leptidea sinapis]|uniref:Uncharacterized protein n=1 Tax=Leptidea sinapis TaxID=189913 RepID=A0A5E4PRD5_9NEOP|nr:unnamed protein product [Leptidea sinapis]